MVKERQRATEIRLVRVTEPWLKVTESLKWD